MAEDVARAFRAFPDEPRLQLLAVRELIFATAAETDGVGPIEEAIRWGEPAYLTSVSGSGSTIRLGWKAAAPGRCAIYLNCRTSLVDSFRSLFSDRLVFEGNRAILLNVADPLPEEALGICLAMTLTYHRRKHALAGPR